MNRLIPKSVYLFFFLFAFLSYNNSFAQCTVAPYAPDGIAVDPANGFIYYSDGINYQILRGNLDGTGTPIVLFDDAEGVENPRDVDIDLVNNLIYWTNFGDGDPPSIMVGAIDGSGVPLVVFDFFGDGVFEPIGIAVDPANDFIYWGEEADVTINSGDLLGPVVTDLFDFADGLEGPQGLDIDVANGKVYWADFSFFLGFTGRIFEANLDGTGTPTVLYDLGSPTAPYGLTIDVVNGKIYFTEGFNGNIQVANLDGSGTPTILFDRNDGVTFPGHIDVDPASGSIYWTEFNDGQILKANADGSGSIEFLFYKTWDGGGDGVSWDDAANWSDDTEPTGADKVRIPQNTSVTISMAGEVASTVLIDQGGTLNISNGGDLTIDNTFCGEGISLENNANLNVAGGLTIFDVDLDGINMHTGSNLFVDGTGVLSITTIPRRAIYVESATVRNAGTITMVDAEEHGIYMLGLNGTQSSFINTGTINFTPGGGFFSEDAIDISGGTFQNIGIININASNDDGISLTQVEGTPSTFTNEFVGMINVMDCDDDALDLNGASNTFINNGTITIDNCSDEGISMEGGDTFTNNCTITMTDVGRGVVDGTFNNNSLVNIGLDAGSTDFAIETRVALNNNACGAINITTDHAISTELGAVVTNDGVITSAVTTPNVNDGTFTNNGEVRPATLTFVPNAISSPPIAGTVPAVQPLDPVTCTFCDVVSVVPTLSEWGLIFLSLILITIGLLFTTSSRMVLAGSKSSSFSIFTLPFERKSYFKILTATAISIGMIFLSAMLFFGYQLTSADPIGFLVTVPIVAYIVFLLKRS